MLSQLRPALLSFIALTIITGIIYPLLVTGIAKTAFPREAAGSLIARGDKLIGSELIAQPFSDPKFFWPRPSAAGYNGAGGSGSNLAPTNPALLDAVTARVTALKAAAPGHNQPIPIDLLTASASGLDPEISAAAAEYQVARIAGARGMPESDVRTLVERYTQPRTFGVLGEPRVNVLKLNLELEHPRSVATAPTQLGDLPAPKVYRGKGFLPENK